MFPKYLCYVYVNFIFAIFSLENGCQAVSIGTLWQLDRTNIIRYTV
jgi:hypothetical protein